MQYLMPTRYRAFRNASKPLSIDEQRRINIRCQKQIDATMHQLRQRFKFFAAVLNQFDHIRPDSNTRTACVRFGARTVEGKSNRAKIEMCVNPMFFASLTPAERIGVFVHEVYHAMYQHLYQIPTNDPLRLYNVAQDIIINHDIINLKPDNINTSAKGKDIPTTLTEVRPGISLIPSCLTKVMFEDIPIDPDKETSAVVLAKLFKKYDEAKQKGPLSEKEVDELNMQLSRYKLANSADVSSLDFTGFTDEEIESILSLRETYQNVAVGINSVLWLRSKIPSEGQGQGQGQDQGQDEGEGEDEDEVEGEGEGESQGEGKSKSKNSKKSPKTDPNAVGGHSDHSHWAEDKKNTEKNTVKDSEGDDAGTQKDEIRRKMPGVIAKAYKECNEKERGELPGHLRGEIEKMLSRPAVYNWRALFKNFMSRATRTSIKMTRQRESQRFVGSEGPRLRRKKRVLVAVDTSGSMSQKAVNDFFAEVDNIVKAAGEVVVVLFHSQPYECFIYKAGMIFSDKSRRTISGKVKSGGTDFVSLFQYIKTCKVPLDAVVVLTDGYGTHPLPQSRPRSPVIWALTEKTYLNDDKMCPWGPRIYIGDDPIK